MYLRENIYINGNSIVLKDRSEGKCKVREKEKSSQKNWRACFFPLSFYCCCIGGDLVSGNTGEERDWATGHRRYHTDFCQEVKAFIV